MIKKVTRNNYRQYYKEYYGIDFGKEFAVHHIDMNRDNNEISNLLLIPSSTHNKFHLSSYIYDSGCKAINPNLKGINASCLNYEIEMLKVYLDSIIIIQEWLGYREMNYRMVQIEGITLTK